jgi:hypothetical protein
LKTGLFSLYTVCLLFGRIRWLVPFWFLDTLFLHYLDTVYI